MKILLKQFKDKSNLTLREEINPDDLDLDIGIMSFHEALQFRAEASLVSDDLTVQVHVEGPRTFTCSLCLEELNNVFEKDFTLHYDIRGLESVVIDQDVRDEIMTENPIRILCRPNCRGLCPLCGANLNNEPCDCKAEV